jgi:hypothetical protein
MRRAGLNSPVVERGTKRGRKLLKSLGGAGKITATPAPPPALFLG